MPVPNASNLIVVFLTLEHGRGAIVLLYTRASVSDTPRQCSRVKPCPFSFHLVHTIYKSFKYQTSIVQGNFFLISLPLLGCFLHRLRFVREKVRFRIRESLFRMSLLYFMYYYYKLFIYVFVDSVYIVISVDIITLECTSLFCEKFLADFQRQRNW